MIASLAFYIGLKICLNGFKIRCLKSKFDYVQGVPDSNLDPPGNILIESCLLSTNSHLNFGRPTFNTHYKFFHID